MRNNFKFFFFKVLCVGFLFICAGCVYQFGTSLPHGMETIHVETFVNKTDEPMLESETTQATIREFQHDGTLKIASADTADMILSVTLEKLDVVTLRYEKDSPKSGEEFRLKLTASLELKNAKNNKIMMQQKVRGETTFFLTGDMFSSKRPAIPLVAKDLAHNIVETVVEFW